MKLSERMKRRLIIFGCAVIGAVLIAAISGQFRGETQGSNHTETWTEQTEEVTVAEIPTEAAEIVTTEEETEPTKLDIVVRTEPAAKPPRIGIAEPTETLPAQADRTEQAVQPVPEKPAAFLEEMLKNPIQKSGGEIVERTLEAIPHEEAVRFSETSTQAGGPQCGDIQNGKIYVPRFGWIDKIGEGQGTVAESMYESGNKIGIMG